MSTSMSRKTKETEVAITLQLIGKRNIEVSTGIGFFDHMLTLWAFQAGFDLSVRAKGDLEVDSHHTVEDVGIVMGQAMRQALGEVRGIRRYGSSLLPMDETLVQSAIDISGRRLVSLVDGCGATFDLPTQRLGEFETELVVDFFKALTDELGATLHIRVLSGRNTHHIIEGIFKSVGLAMRMALEIDVRFPDQIPSTKGQLGEAT